MIDQSESKQRFSKHLFNTFNNCLYLTTKEYAITINELYLNQNIP